MIKSFGYCRVSVAEWAAKINKEFNAELPQLLETLPPSTQQSVADLFLRENETRDRFTAAELRFALENGMSKWVMSHSIRWSLMDSWFALVAKEIWDRSPQMQEEDLILDLALKWGLLDREERRTIKIAMEKLDMKDRRVTTEERDMVRSFTGGPPELPGFDPPFIWIS